jgi:hypothetical protein
MRGSIIGKRGVDHMVEFKYEIVERIAVLSESSKGWTKELNLISWNGREAKYDIREWSPDNEKTGKGVTLTDEEILQLKNALMGRDI